MDPTHLVALHVSTLLLMLGQNMVEIDIEGSSRDSEREREREVAAIFQGVSSSMRNLF